VSKRITTDKRAEAARINGAKSGGPKPPRARPYERPDGTCSLQWGRDQLIAEIQALFCSTNNLPVTTPHKDLLLSRPLTSA